MQILFDSEGSTGSFMAHCEKLAEDPTVQAVMILGCEENPYDAAALSVFLKKMPKPVFGGIFPGIIFKDAAKQKGAVFAGFDVPVDVRSIPDIGSPLTNIDERIALFRSTVDAAQTMAVFVDGFSRRIDDLVESLFTVFGLQRNYIGGGCGALSSMDVPCVISNEGLARDAAVIAFLPFESGIGVRHGWSAVEGPFKVTEAEFNVIKTLDWRPAFEVYKEVVDAFSGESLHEENFSDLAKSFPFGINKLEGEMIVRDPFSIGEKNSLICVGGVPEGSYVSILNGNADTLIEAAVTARDEAVSQKPPSARSLVFFMECISRFLFLGDDFTEELRQVKTGKHNFVGALTIGEIANSGKNYLEFYNKTSVVGVMGP